MFVNILRISSVVIRTSKSHGAILASFIGPMLGDIFKIFQNLDPEPLALQYHINRLMILILIKIRNCLNYSFRHKNLHYDQ